MAKYRTAQTYISTSLKLLFVIIQCNKYMYFPLLPRLPHYQCCGYVDRKITDKTELTDEIMETFFSFTTLFGGGWTFHIGFITTIGQKL